MVENVEVNDEIAGAVTYRSEVISAFDFAGRHLEFRDLSVSANGGERRSTSDSVLSVKSKSGVIEMWAAVVISSYVV